MNKLIIWLISLFYFVSTLIINSYAQDTITINKGFLLSNIVLNYSSDSIYTDIELLNDDYRISGYLFIQLDSNTKYNLAAKSPVKVLIFL